MKYLLLLCLGALATLSTAVKYEIKTYTSDVTYAGTDANVKITLYGSRGSSSALRLYSNNYDVFERAAVDTFIVDSHDVGQLSKIKVGHDNSGWGPGWKVQKIKIRVYKSNDQYTEFQCNTWISSAAKIFSAPGSCGVTKISSSRIVGGNIARPGAWPWQISIDHYYGNQGWLGHWCGGSIISNQWIVSAAHCFNDQPRKEYYKITVGQHDLRSNDGYEQVIAIEKIIIHSSYDKDGQDNDIALIKLKDPIKYNDRALPVCLPTQDLSAGTECYISGWGALSEGGSGPAVLHQAKVPLVDHNTCQNMYAGYGMAITSRMRCAGYTSGGIDSCQGDSGGPLVCKVGGRWHLMGVVSWGVGCARVGVYGVYADTVNLKSWILNSM